MAEYIDREALMERFQFRIPVTSEIGRVYKECVDLGRQLISEAPAADVAKVVRCEECKQWGGVTFGNICRRWTGLNVKNCTRPDDFCSYGERKV